MTCELLGFTDKKPRRITVKRLGEITWLVRGDVEYQPWSAQPQDSSLICCYFSCLYSALYGTWHIVGTHQMFISFFSGQWWAMTVGLFSHQEGHTPSDHLTLVTLGRNDKHEVSKGFRAFGTLWGIREHCKTFWVILCHSVVILAHILSSGSWFLLLMNSLTVWFLKSLVFLYHWKTVFWGDGEVFERNALLHLKP